VVCRLRAHAPFFEEVYRKGLYISAICRVDRDNGNLGMSLLVNLTADFCHLREGICIYDMREVIDVSGGLELRNRFGFRTYAQPYQGGSQAYLHAPGHSKIVQDIVTGRRAGRGPTAPRPGLPLSWCIRNTFTFVICGGKAYA
jgi:hypothetical protein